MHHPQFHIFNNLNFKQIEHFTTLCQQFTFPAGKVLVQQNQTGEMLYFLLAGNVRIYLNTPQGEQTLSSLEAPTVLGEISFFSNEPSSANVITLTQTEALAIPFQKLRQHLYQGDAVSTIIMLNIAQEVAKRAAAMTRKVSELYAGQKSPESQIRNAGGDLFSDWSFI